MGRKKLEQENGRLLLTVTPETQGYIKTLREEHAVNMSKLFAIYIKKEIEKYGSL